MAPKARRRASKSRDSLVSSQSFSQLGESSISAPNSLAETSQSLSATGPERSLSTASQKSDATPKPKTRAKPKRRGASRRRRKSTASEGEEEETEEPTTLRYSGPPPDEEFLDEVMKQLQTIDKWKQEDWIEQLHLILREGEVGIGQDCNTRNVHGYTPLAVASAAGDARIVALLLEHRADPSLGSTGRSELPLHHAANYRHPIVTQLLVGPCQQKGIIDARTTTGWTPLHTCAQSGDKQVFKLLMRAKADLETRNPITGNEHALHVAARAANIDIIEILLAADADVNCQDSLCRTPLHLAATMTHGDCVGLLLRSKANALHRGGPSHQIPLECVPATHHDMAERERVLRLLTSYGRSAPSPPRTDIRFDQRDERSLV